jgi:hypothetical protein
MTHLISYDDYVELASFCSDEAGLCQLSRRLDFEPTPDQMELGLSHQWWEVRYAFAKRSSFTPTEAQFRRGIFDENLIVRSVFHTSQFKFPEEQMERGLTDENPIVREVFSWLIKNASPSQMERGLTDTNPSVRSQFARLAVKNKISLTPFQINRALSDDHWSVISYLCLNGYVVPSEAQLELGLTHPEASIRQEFIQLGSVSLTTSQIARGLADVDSGVREKLIMRPDFKPTLAQIQLGLTDEDNSVRQAFERHKPLLSALLSRQSLINESNLSEYDRRKRTSL